MQTGYSIIGEADHQSATLRLIRSRLPEIVIVDGDCKDINIIELAEVLEEDPISALIVLTNHITGQYIDKAKNYWYFFYGVKQLPDSMLASNIDVAYASFRRSKKMEQEIDKLKKTLETRKLVDKAKGILMMKKDMSEDQAFRYIQKLSMDKSLPMKEVANAIIITESV